MNLSDPRIVRLYYEEKECAICGGTKWASTSRSHSRRYQYRRCPCGSSVRCELIGVQIRDGDRFRVVAVGDEHGNCVLVDERPAA